MFFISSEEMRKEMLEKSKNAEYPKHSKPSWYKGAGYEIINSFWRAYDKLKSPFSSDEDLGYRSDPETQGLGAQLVEGASDLVPYMAVSSVVGKALSIIPSPPTKVLSLALQHLPKLAGLAYAGLSAKHETSKLYQSQGVDKETSDELGIQAGFVTAGSIATPAVLGTHSLTKLAWGSGASVATGAVNRGLSSKVLEDHGYLEMAEQYKILDLEAVTLDAMLGLFFGVIHTKEANNLGGKAGSILGELRDGISERLFFRHVNQDNSPVLHTTTNAHNDHLDLVASGTKDIMQGKIPEFSEAKIRNVMENSIEDPNFKSRLLELEPQPSRKLKTEQVKPSEQQQQQPHNKFTDIDEHASSRYRELEAKHPELAKEVHENLHEIIDNDTLVKKNSLYQVAIDCFLRTGG